MKLKITIHNSKLKIIQLIRKLP